MSNLHALHWPEHTRRERSGLRMEWLLAAKDDGETVAWNLPVIRSELAKLGLNWESRQK